MYSRPGTPKRCIIKMDPNCAICHNPASHSCDCEAKGLEQAIKEAEDRAMRPIYLEIRYVCSVGPTEETFTCLLEVMLTPAQDPGSVLTHKIISSAISIS